MSKTKCSVLLYKKLHSLSLRHVCFQLQLVLSQPETHNEQFPVSSSDVLVVSLTRLRLGLSGRAVLDLLLCSGEALAPPDRSCEKGLSLTEELSFVNMQLGY